MAKRGQEFDAARARTKRPVPMWADAFLRDTMHLAADEIGAYHLLLYAMWQRPSCDLPDDDRRLAKIARVSTRLWNSRIGPTLRDFLEAEYGVVFSRRLRREADYIERELSKQSERRRRADKDGESGGDKKSRTYAKPVGAYEGSHENAENSHNPLKSPDQGQSADIPRNPPRTPPSQQPNNPTYDDDDDARARPREAPPSEPTHRERLLEAMGADPATGLTGPNGRILGTQSDMEEAGRWADDLGLSEEDQLSVVREVMARKAEPGPPASFRYFTPAMRELAGARNAPRLSPAAPKEGAAAPHPMPRIIPQLPKEYRNVD